MKFSLKALLVFLVAFATTSLNTFAQGRFKAGAGVNYISNNYESPRLYDYFAPSVNLSYTFLKQGKFGLAIENATAARSILGIEERKYGLSTSLPLIASLQLNNTSVYIGSGPSYIQQSYETSTYKEKASGYFLNNLVGVGFKGKAVFWDAVYPEYNIRISYQKSLSQPALDAGMVSFIVFLRS